MWEGCREGRVGRKGEGELTQREWCFISKPVLSYLGLHFVNIVLASAGCNN